MKGITKDNYLTEITKKIEALGILVMRSSYIGSNTRKSLSVKEFRGLAISDPYAHFYINTADVKSAQIFTLSHELGHLMLEGRLASNLDEEKASDRFAGGLLSEQIK